MVLIKNVKDVLEKHDYKVSLLIKDDKTLQAIFPERKTDPCCPSFSNIYDFRGDGGVTFVNHIGEEELVLAPKYAYKPLIISDVFQLCSAISYDYNLVYFYDRGTEIEAEEFYKKMLPFKLSHKEKKQDEKLSDITERCLEIGPTPELKEQAVNDSVLAGYNAVTRILFGETDE